MICIQHAQLRVCPTISIQVAWSVLYQSVQQILLNLDFIVGRLNRETIYSRVIETSLTVRFVYEVPSQYPPRQMPPK